MPRQFLRTGTHGSRILLAQCSVVGILLFVSLAPITGGSSGFDTTAHAQGSSHTFPETGKTVKGRFLQYWQKHGGLAQQGFPISSEMQEKSDTDGKLYTVQYFERAVFELHPENAPSNDVLLSLLGVFLYQQKYPKGAPNQTTNTSEGSVLFKETGYRVGGKFLKYWQEHGGLAQQGYPLSEEFTEVSDLDGKAYRVQYFERAVFEEHPENQAPYDVLLSQLGTFRYEFKTQPKPTATPMAVPPTPTPTPPGETLGPEDYQTTFVDKNGQTRKFTYDNAKTSEGLLTLGLTLVTDEDRSDYAELLKRTGRTTDFSFKVVGYDETTGEPPSGWQAVGSFGISGGPALSFIYQFDQNRNLLIKYRNRSAFEQIKNDPRLARVFGTKVGMKVILASISQGDSISTLSDLGKVVGTDPQGQRIWHKLGLNATGYESNFDEKAWASFWSIQK